MEVKPLGGTLTRTEEWIVGIEANDKAPVRISIVRPHQEVVANLGETEQDKVATH
jgi:hypothetical protein